MRIHKKKLFATQTSAKEGLCLVSIFVFMLCRHLSKCFDNLHDLKLVHESAQSCIVANGMYSGEGEFVGFQKSYDCTGAVEVWLKVLDATRPIMTCGSVSLYSNLPSDHVHISLASQRVVRAMREALSCEFKASIVAYDDRPRGTWTLDNCAQIATLVSRLFFTQEILAAFGRLEDGDEDAMKASCSPMLVWTNTAVGPLVNVTQGCAAERIRPAGLSTQGSHTYHQWRAVSK